MSKDMKLIMESFRENMSEENIQEAHGLDADDVKTLEKHVKKLENQKQDKVVQKVLKALLKSNIKVKKSQDLSKKKKKINEQAYDPNIQKAQTKIYRQAVAMHNKAQKSGMEGDAAYIATVFHGIRKANDRDISPENLKEMQRMLDSMKPVYNHMMKNSPAARSARLAGDYAKGAMDSLTKAYKDAETAAGDHEPLPSIDTVTNLGSDLQKLQKTDPEAYKEVSGVFNPTVDDYANTLRRRMDAGLEDFVPQYEKEKPPAARPKRKAPPINYRRAIALNKYYAKKLSPYNQLAGLNALSLAASNAAGMGGTAGLRGKDLADAVLQAQMNVGNLYKGRLDGIIGPGTQRALRKLDKMKPKPKPEKLEKLDLPEVKKPQGHSKKKTVKELKKVRRTGKAMGKIDFHTPAVEVDPRTAEEEADDIMRAQFGPDIDKMKKYDDGGRTEKEQEEAERMPTIRKKYRNVGFKGPTELNARAKKVKQSLSQFIDTMHRTQRIMGDDLTKEQAYAFRALEKHINAVYGRIENIAHTFFDLNRPD